MGQLKGAELGFDTGMLALNPCSLYSVPHSLDRTHVAPKHRALGVPDKAIKEKTRGKERPLLQLPACAQEVLTWEAQVVQGPSSWWPLTPRGSCGAGADACLPGMPTDTQTRTHTYRKGVPPRACGLGPPSAPKTLDLS